MLCSSLDRFRNEGLLLLRVGLGLMFMYHGWPKVTGGAAAWTKLGMSMSFVGIGFLAPFWGFMAAAAEFGGGLLLTITMAVAVAMKLGTGAGLGGASQALELGIVFLSLIFIGPGQYSMEARMCGRRR